MSPSISILDIVLFNMVSFFGGVFTGMFAGVKLRNTILQSRSRDNLSHMGGTTTAGLYPPIVPSAPVAHDMKHNEIVIRTTE